MIQEPGEGVRPHPARLPRTLPDSTNFWWVDRRHRRLAMSGRSPHHHRATARSARTNLRPPSTIHPTPSGPGWVQMSLLATRPARICGAEPDPAIRGVTVSRRTVCQRHRRACPRKVLGRKARELDDRPQPPWNAHAATHDRCASSAAWKKYDGAPKGNRTPVFAVRGRRPRPLDDGSFPAAWRCYSHDPPEEQGPSSEFRAGEANWAADRDCGGQ